MEVLANVGAVSPSTFPFSPHVTMSRENYDYPTGRWLPKYVHLE